MTVMSPSFARSSPRDPGDAAAAPGPSRELPRNSGDDGRRAPAHQQHPSDLVSPGLALLVLLMYSSFDREIEVLPDTFDKILG